MSGVFGPGISHKPAYGENVPLYDKMLLKQVYHGFVKLMPDKLQRMSVLWKDVYFEEQKISVDWGRLFDQLFREEAYVQQRNHVLHPNSDSGIAMYAEIAEKDLKI